MARYLTVAQYKAADDGLAGAPDMTIARMIARAETDIDSFMGFDLSNGGFEPHEIWFQSRFDERTLKISAQNYPVPIRRVTRYRIQVSNLSTSGAGFFADINPGDCVINVSDGYVEIVPLQAVTYSLSPVLLQLGLRPPIVQMDCEIGFYQASFGEQLYEIDPNSTTFAALRGFWETSYNQALATQPNKLPPVPPIVYVDGVPTNGYILNTIEGTVTFPSSMAGHTITADFTYAIPDEVRDACIDQVTYLLGLRALNQMGMQGSVFLHNGDVEIRTLDSVPKTGAENNGALCKRAAQKLARYEAYPIG